MRVLTIHEQILLLAIWRLRDNAYGVRIRQSVADATKMVYTYGTLYSSLEQLVKKGYVTKTIGEATAERGGRRKIYYEVSPEGMKSLKEAKELQNTLWDGIPEVTFSEEK
ncbi:MAG: PadR family transcriptional regulator [bacterium]|nr:PadR family transcriptional regulator [bacterium]